MSFVNCSILLSIVMTVYAFMGNLIASVLAGLFSIIIFLMGVVSFLIKDSE